MKWNRFLTNSLTNTEHSDRIGMENNFLTWFFTLFIFSVDATNVNNNNSLKTVFILLNSATNSNLSQTTNYFKTIQSDSFHRNIDILSFYFVSLVLEICLFFVLFSKMKSEMCVVFR